MDPRADDQLATPCIRRATAFAQAIKAGKGAFNKDVVPAPHVERRHPNFTPAFLQVQRRPIVIVFGVEEQIVPKRQVTPSGRVDGV